MGSLWYLMHFLTTQGKFRIVYNGSAKFKKRSINQEILQGPDLLQPLVNVITPFWKGTIAMTADVSECFFPYQQKFFRIIWFENDNLYGNC